LLAVYLSLSPLNKTPKQIDSKSKTEMVGRKHSDLEKSKERSLQNP